MTALRVCDGGVSSEHRKISGASAAAAPVRSAGAAIAAIAERANLRRVHDFMLVSCLVLARRARRAR
jgi:hypothetical protein